MHEPTAQALLTILILTKDEERHIPRLMANLAQLQTPKRIVVIDSFSTDSTVQLAQHWGAEVLQNRFVNQAVQFQWGIDRAQVTTPWVMRIDADELIEADLARDLDTKLPTLAPAVVGITLWRKHVFMDRWIRHGGRYPLAMVRIWRNGHGRVENRWMDEHVVVSGGEVITLKGGFVDHNLNDLTYFTDKHNKYATREAVEVLNQKYSLFPRDEGMQARDMAGHTAWKRIIKERFYNHIPFHFAALGYFLYRYILQLGFLDGKPGLIYHLLQGYWYRFLVGARIYELEKSLVGLSDPAEIIEKLEACTMLDLRVNAKKAPGVQA